MNVFTWGAVALLVYLFFNRRARKAEEKGIAIALLAYLFKRRHKSEHTLTYEEHERKWRRRFLAKSIVGFMAVWLYGVIAHWGSGIVVAVYACGIVGMLCVCNLTATKHYRTTVLPFYMTMCNLASWPTDGRPSRWIRVPRGASRTGIPSGVAWLFTSGKVWGIRLIPSRMQKVLRDDAGWLADRLWPVGSSEIRVKLPKDMHADARVQKDVESLVASRFPGHWTPRSNTRKFVMSFVPTRPLPTMAKLPESWIALDYGDELTVPLGMTEADKWSFIEMESETPHVLIAGQTGSGKTVTITMQIAWILMHGGIVDIIDPKIVGFADGRKGKIDLRGLPGVRIHTEVETWNAVIIEYRESMRAVYAALERGEDVDDRSKFPSRLLVIDEKGGYTRAMQAYWKQSGRKGEPTAFNAEDDILQQGRAARHFMTTGAQQANAKVLRSTDARFNYGAKIGCGPQDAMSWRMLFAGKRQSCPMVKGRGHWSTTGEATAIQFAYLTQDQVVRMAAIGEVVRRSRAASAQPSGEPLSAPLTGVPVQGDAGAVPGEIGLPVPAQPVRQADGIPAVIVGIDAAASFLSMTKDAFIRARKLRPIEGEIRRENRPVWNVVDLREWHSKRPIAGKRPLAPTEVIMSKDATGE